MTSKIIDDQDPQVTYVGGWVHGGTDKEYGGTVTSGTKAGDYFTVKFEGTSISVYGTVDSTSGGVVTSYAVDGSSAYSAQVTSTAGSGDTYKQLFWASPTLGSGNHQLLVNMVQLNPNPQPGEGTIWFDYFNVTKGPSISPSPSPASVTNPPAARKKSNKIGTIVGIVGGIVILIALALLLLFYRRRRRLSRNVKPKVRLDPPVAPAYPDPTEQNSTHHASTDQFLVTRDMSQGPNGYTVTLVPPTMDFPEGHGSSHFSPTSSSSAFTSTGKYSARSGGMYSVNPDHDALLNENRKALEKSNEARKYASSSAEPVQHADSGLRAIDPESIPPGGRVEFPPAYTAT